MHLNRSWTIGLTILAATVAVFLTSFFLANTPSALTEKARRADLAKRTAAASLDQDARAAGVAKKAVERETAERKAEQLAAIDRPLKAIAEHKVFVGMTEAQVTASWGKPEKINTTITAGGSREQWVYGIGEYLYIQDGLLSSIQSSK